MLSYSYRDDLPSSPCLPSKKEASSQTMSMMIPSSESGEDVAFALQTQKVKPFLSGLYENMSLVSYRIYLSGSQTRV